MHLQVGVCNASTAIVRYDLYDLYELKEFMRSELSTFSCSQIKMARASLNWSIERLSQNSGVSISTIKRMETEPGFLKAPVPNIQMIKKLLRPQVLNSLVRLRMALEFVFGPQTDKSKHNNLF